MTVLSYLPALQKDTTATKQTKEDKKSNSVFRDVIFAIAEQRKEFGLLCVLFEKLFASWERQHRYNFWHNFTKNPVKPHLYDKFISVEN